MGNVVVYIILNINLSGKGFKMDEETKKSLIDEFNLKEEQYSSFNDVMDESIEVLENINDSAYLVMYPLIYRN